MTFLNPRERLILKYRHQVKQMTQPFKCLPQSVLHLTLYVGQVWDIAQLGNLPHGIAWIKDQDRQRGTPAEASITIGVYRAELLYSFQAGKFMVARVVEAQDPISRSELWKIAGRSLKDLLGQGVSRPRQRRTYEYDL